VTFDKAKFLPRFIDEAREHLKRINEGLLTLEKTPDDPETVHAVFRSAHTIKGSSRMMRMIPISEAAHKIEDLLQAVRQGEVGLTREICDLLFRGVDAVESLIDRTAAGEEIAEIPAEALAVCEALERAAGGIEEATEDREQKTEDRGRKTEDRERKTEDVALKESASSTGSTLSTPSTPSTPTEPEDRPAPKAPRFDETLRISADKLDDLIKLMGEIVSGHNRAKHRLTEAADMEKAAWRLVERFSELAADDADGRVAELGGLLRSFHSQIKTFLLDFKEDVNTQGLLTADLQDQSLDMRMLPLSTLFDPFRRTVRTLARASGKEVDLVISGEETELDRKIIEKLGDPLVHMIRNSIDHGIEAPDVRRAAGKPETGTIRLSARYEGGHAIIDLADDGAGIQVDGIKETACKKNLAREGDLESLTADEALNLIFLPGVSTAGIITHLSGRGVGMDVVRRNIDELKGAVTVRTGAGTGTSFRIRLPLTMAVIHVLFIRVWGTTFAVPAHYIDEIVRAGPEDLISVVDQRAVRRGGRLIPVVDLGEVLGLPGGAPAEAAADSLILIASAGNEGLGVVIDELVNEEEMVIKPLPPHLRKLPLVSGAIISGRNEIFNVLHMPKIIEAARETRRRAPAAEAPETDEATRRHILIVDDSVSTREIEKSILESYGYEVTAAGDGQEGYDRARRFRYDLIVTDVEMPRMDGFVLTETLRRTETYRETPIILVTSLDREEDRRRGMAAGADAYIVKGAFDQTTLLDSVRNLLG